MVWLSIAALTVAILVSGCASNKRCMKAAVATPPNPPSTSVLAVETPLYTADSFHPEVSVPSHNWPENSFQGGRWTDDGDNDGTSCWCNAEGDWGITSTMSNHSVWCHNYRMGVECGHMDNSDPNTFVAYSSQSSENVTLCGHHAQKMARASGAKVDVIQDNFNRINAARLAMYEF